MGFFRWNQQKQSSRRQRRSRLARRARRGFIALLMALSLFSGNSTVFATSDDTVGGGGGGVSGGIQANTAACTSNPDQEVERSVDQLIKELSQYIVINKKTGRITEISTKNFLFTDKGTSREFAKIIADIVRGRSPSMQEKINQRLTAKLREYGMSFTEKNGNKAVFFDVAVNGIPMAMTRSSFDMYVQSTAPVLRAQRALEQIYFSHEKSEVTPTMIRETIKAQTGQEISCSDKELDAMLLSMNEGIYDIKKLHHPVMKDFPYLAIAGVDAMPDTSEPSEMKPVFAEFNLGTPSGVSNIRYCMSAWIEEDPEMAKAVLPLMAKDHTYSNLRRVIEKNAAAWTGNKNGIAVMVGPGAYNGAHPDVSSISYFSGMPLVNKSDLYIDASGNVRLNAGKDTDNPVVTGIYSRQEESFLLEEAAIPFISPNYNDMQGIVKKIIETDKSGKYSCLKNKAQHMAKGVWYQWEYGKNADGSANFDDIVGVKLDENCNPVAATSMLHDVLGVDPTVPGAKRGGLADAVLNKKLYANVIGARVVDDKKVFEIASKCFSKQFVRDGAEKDMLTLPVTPGSSEKQTYVAAPPKSYTPDEFVPLFNKILEDGKTDIKALDRFSEFVLKEPDGSGGAGVYILINYPPEERAKIVKEHFLDDPSMVQRMVVQQFVRAAAMTMPMSKAGVSRYFKPEVVAKVDPSKLENFKTTYLTQANDLRIFTMMDSEGNVVADPHSILVRTAKPTILELGINGDSRSNTSKGGGYGVLAVIEDKVGKNEALNVEALLAHPESLLAAEEVQPFISQSKQEALNRFLMHIWSADAWMRDYEEGKNDLFVDNIELIRVYQREIMEILGPSFAPLMSKVRDVMPAIKTVKSTNSLDILDKSDPASVEAVKTFHAYLVKFINTICSKPPVHVNGLADNIKAHSMCSDTRIITKK